jgi:hypothetical protein
VDTTRDNKGRKRYNPEKGRGFLDWLWPKRHGKWWNYDKARQTTKGDLDLYEDLKADDEKQAKATLEHVDAIAQGAVDRAAAADRRASTIAGTVAIAASFTIGGAGLVLDTGKITDADTRRWMAVVLCVTTVFFVLSAFYALRALVSTRQWNFSLPWDLPVDPAENDTKRLGMRAAHLLEDFAANWEIADLKNRNVDTSLVCLLVALAGIAAVSGLLVGHLGLPF